jgi:7-cyano-7-deazaguanine synthase
LTAAFYSPIYLGSAIAFSQQFLQALGQQPNLSELVVLDLPLRDLYEQHWSVSGKSVPNATSPDEAVFLPGRNALLLVKAIVWCQMHAIPNIALAPLGTSPFYDARDPFFNNFQAAMNCGDLPAVQILRPFTGMSKREVMEMGSEFPLELTFSCIAPIQDKHCGQCNKCAERKQAFKLIDLPDRTAYAR